MTIAPTERASTGIAATEGPANRGALTESRFHLNLEQIRQHAKASLDQGAVTPANQLDKGTILDILQNSLATELVCTLRYKQNAIIAENIGAEVVAEEFWEHADQEANHADKLAQRIAVLGGSPDYNPATLLERSHAEYNGFTEDDINVLDAMIEKNLIAERIAIETYLEIVRFIGDKDPTTRRLFEEVLAEEEEHADDLVGLLNAIRGKRRVNARPSA